MKKEKNGVYLFIIIVFIGIFYFYNNNQPRDKKTIKTKSISFLNGPILMKENETYKTNIIFNPVNGNEKIEYYIEDTDIANVDKYGNITSKKEGSTFLIATLKNGIQDNITVVVKNTNNNQKIEKLSIDEYKIKMKVKEKYHLKYTILPNNLLDKVSWYSSNPNVVSADKGIISALEVGTAIVTVYYNNLIYDSVNVTVDRSQ